MREDQIVKDTIETVTTILVDDPVNDTVHHPYSAYNQGFAAYGLGLVLNVNPYMPGREFDFWDMGWKDARDQEDDDTGYTPKNIDGTPCGKRVQP
jgi:hypothetical protein